MRKIWVQLFLGGVIFSLIGVQSRRALGCFSDDTPRTYYKVSWPTFKQRAEDFHRVSSFAALQPEEFSLLVDQILDRFGSTIPGFQTLNNRVDSSLSVKDLMKSTALRGLPSLGSETSAMNEQVRRMMAHIFQVLGDESEKSPDYFKAFKTLAAGFLDCQQVQYRAIQKVYRDLTGQRSLSGRVFGLIDTLKRKWLMQTLFYLNNDVSYRGLNPHLENAYLKVIGQTFGLPHYEAALHDQNAVREISEERAENVYRSYVNSEEVISAVYDDFRGSKDPQDHAEIFQWITENFASQADEVVQKFYDEDGLINRWGVEQILLSQGILEAVSRNLIAELMERQESITEGFLSNLGVESWADFRSKLNGYLLSDDRKKIKESIDHQDYRIYIWAPSSVRESILKNGLKNQYQTGSSRGTFGIPLRFSAERAQLNMGSEEYEQIPPALRPKYGILVPKAASRMPKLSHYGDDVYLLDTEKMRGRLTWTPFFSLNSYSTRANKQGVKWNYGEVSEPNSIEELYLPGSQLQFLTPFVHLKYSKSGYSFPEHIMGMSRKASAKFPIVKGSIQVPNVAGGQVVEVQVWGPVYPSDISRFGFSAKPPSTGEISLLSRNQIEVIELKDNSPYGLVFYKLGEDGICRKVEYSQGVLKILDEEVLANYCEVDGKVVYDPADHQIGKIIRVDEDNLLLESLTGRKKFWKAPLEKLAVESGSLFKSTGFDRMEFKKGDSVYNSKRDRKGKVVRVYQGDRVEVRYSCGGVAIERLENLHKRKTREQIEEGIGPFKIDDTVEVGIYPFRRTGRITHFLDEDWVEVLLNGKMKSDYFKRRQLSHPRDGWSFCRHF